MIIFLYGPDSYRRQQKQKEIINQYKNKHSSLSIEKIDLEDDGAAEKLKEFVEARSLFDSFKLVVIYGLNDQIKDVVGPYIRTKEVVFLINSNDKPLKELAFLINPPVIFQEFINLNYERFKRFILSEARKRNLSLKSDTLNFLAQQFEADSWGLINKLDKLVLASSLTKNDRKVLVKYNIFSEIQQLTNSNLTERLKSLEILLKKEDSAKIFNLVAYSRSFDRTRAAAYDLAIKSGKLDYETALLDLAIK